MVTPFVLGIPFTHEILLTLATEAVRHPRPSASLTRSLTLSLTSIIEVRPPFGVPGAPVIT